MMKVENYPNAYKEVYVILENMNVNDVRKIPESFLDIVKTKMNDQYEFKLDRNKDFRKQKLLKETKIILAYISLNYWATNEQKDKIKKKFRQDIINEENKKSKYIPEELFKNRHSKMETKSIEKPKNEMIRYEKSGFFSKTFKKIKNIFNMKYNN